MSITPYQLNQLNYRENTMTNFNSDMSNLTNAPVDVDFASLLGYEDFEDQEALVCEVCDVLFYDTDNLIYIRNTGICTTCLDCEEPTELDQTLTTENHLMTITDIMVTIKSDSYNEQAIASRIASDLFINTDNHLSVAQCLVVATSFTDNAKYVNRMDKFIPRLQSAFITHTVTVLHNGHVSESQPTYELDQDLYMQALVNCDLLTADHELGDSLGNILSLQKTAYLPTSVSGRMGYSNTFERRMGYSAVNHSDFFVEAIHALESTEYTVDHTMLDIVQRVIGQVKLGSNAELKMLVNDESYVIDGCTKIGDDVVISEFHGDRRGRMYQAACHGPNGQSSDRSRSLMNLSGVSYTADQIPMIRDVIKAEMLDMVGLDGVTDNAQIITLIKSAAHNPVDFIISVLSDADSVVKKPWSFVKASMIWVDLARGNMPYIGMAVGLDAKCSGPQLAALMVGDEDLARATGFNTTGPDANKDAYNLAIAAFDKYPQFRGLKRPDIKKAYMAVFYGQGYGAFTQYHKDMDKNLAARLGLHAPGDTCSDVTAKLFHKILVSSFGKKMNLLRNMMKSYSGKIAGKVKHSMPDGFEVAMNYKIKYNALGQPMEYNTLETDVQVGHLKFINLQLKSHTVDCDNFARNGFVNMIQAVDAQIARLIIVNLKRMGAQHIISVHDCFRVNVTEMAMLKSAIKLAYTQLFTPSRDKATPDLVLGTDILSMYFDGINKRVDQKMSEEVGVNFEHSATEPTMDCDKKSYSQFLSVQRQDGTIGKGPRYFDDVDGVDLIDLIDALGTSYYFDK